MVHSFAKEPRDLSKASADLTALQSFFCVVIDAETYTGNIPDTVKVAIRTAGRTSFGNKPLFDRLEIRATASRDELIAIGIIESATGDTYYPIVQWREPIGSIDDHMHTSIEEIRQHYQRQLQAETTRKQIAAAKKKRDEQFTLIIYCLPLVLGCVFILAGMTLWAAASAMISLILLGNNKGEKLTHRLNAICLVNIGLVISNLAYLILR